MKITSKTKCKDCVFFEYLDVSMSLSLTEGHCKLLEMINNKHLAKCSGVEGCIANDDLHTLKNELTKDQIIIFDDYYVIKTDLVKKLYTLLHGDNYTYEEFDDYKRTLGLDDLGFEIEEEIENIKMELWKLSGQVKRYYYTFTGKKYPKKW